MASVTSITFIISTSSLWLSTLSQDSAPPIINNYITINLYGIEATPIESISSCEDGNHTYNYLVQKPADRPCQPNPCLHGGSCISTDDKKDYLCTNCPQSMGGKNCSDLTCGPDCFKVGDSVYFIYPNTNRTFTSSYSKCQEEGMRLAVIKDPSVHDPVKRYLAAHTINRYYCYWIGLNRTSEADPWKWVDGTELGTYQPWFQLPGSGTNCGDICSGRWSFNFASDFCSATDHYWQYFSLCEKTLLIIPD